MSAKAIAAALLQLRACPFVRDDASDTDLKLLSALMYMDMYEALKGGPLK